MIIRCTFHDNDFTDILEKIATDRKVDIITYSLENRIFSEEDFKKHREYVELYKKIKDIARKKRLRKEEKDLLVRNIKESIMLYSKNFGSYSKNGDTVEYLKRNLDVKIMHTITDKWENYEVCYMFYNKMQYILA